MRAGAAFVVTIVVGIVLFSSQITAIEPSGKSECNGRDIERAVINGELKTALALTQQCYESEKADLDRLQHEGQQGGLHIVDAVGLCEIVTGSFLIAKIEILALQGAFSDADSVIVDAEKFDQQHQNAGIDWNMNGNLFSKAKAFVLEKKGDLQSAAAAYEAILAEQKKGGWSANPADGVRGRLAIVALLRGDDTAVERWANEKGVLQSDPAANAAFGALSQKRGDATGAKRNYANAVRLMTDRAKESNWSLPIYFAEWKRAKDGLARAQRQQ